MTPIAIAAYLVLFAAVGFVFVFASLLLGRFLRPNKPSPLKLDVYECGEPTIGSGYVQFDLRFYVIALVFLIFEVEVAMFYPTATIFGKAMQLLNPNLAVMVKVEDSETAAKNAEQGANAKPSYRLNPVITKTYNDLGVPVSARPMVDISAAESGVAPVETSNQMKSQCQTLALTAMLDLGLFFAVLLVGFAFVWSRGDLDWVRAVRHLPTPAETAASARRLRSENS
jgi:NADH-quinone oxidoreductase subunit A